MVFEIDGADHPESGMPAPTVVDHFNPVGNGLAGSIAGGPALPVVELGFQRRPERLGHRVIEAHPGTPYRLSNAQVAAHLPELLAGKLRPTVGVKHQPVRNVTAEVYAPSVGPFRPGKYLARYP